MDTGQGTNTASGGKITIEFINKDVTGDTGRIRTDSMTQQNQEANYRNWGERKAKWKECEDRNVHEIQI